MKRYFGLKWFMRLGQRRFREVAGLENLPRFGPFILAGNHIGSPDPIFIMSIIHSVLQRPVIFLAYDKVVNFFGKKIAYNWLGVIGKDEERPGESLKYLKIELENGNPVAIFPEGMRNSAPFLMPGKTGAARLAHWTGAPVVPFGFQGPATWTFNQGVYATLLFKKDMRLRIGRPLHFQKIEESKITKDLLIHTTHEIMAIIGQLADRPSPY
ncbi:1-acyl-sn-glycerol-3-phosphate acyltransferase [Candidatus Parcubacteria bacterium]|jgi:1-acyl-sn-glycerol-3-phosphate acyltransferase|nr:MAG: 1-acyl-sn-glycerol-3-phosphate acyltransferase [Candidatus Parcubacteria bacterium]